MHIVGAVANGKTVECHLTPEGVDRAAFTTFLEPDDGYIDLPTGPGLGIAWNHDYLAETKVTR
jgi:L-alanine-DL-glutamate epimerase-like enolase superfamily enzyme